MRWEQVAAMLGVSRTTLFYWRKSDSKIDSIFELGKSDLATKLADRMIEKALAGGLVQTRSGEHVSGEEGNTSALIHLSKRALDLEDKQVNVNVTPEDLAGGDNSTAARRHEALVILGLEMLEPRPEPEDEPPVVELDRDGPDDGD